MQRLVLFAALAAVALPPRAGAEALVRRFEGEGASVTLSIEPAEVSPERDCEAVVRLQAAPPRTAAPPSDWAGRFDGFELGGAYTDEEGALHLSLSPRPGAPRYRIRPFAVAVSDGAGGSAWFATEAVDLPAAPLPRVAAAPAAALAPARIGPGARAVRRGALAALGAAALLGLAALGVRALLRLRRLRRLSPRERALRELDRLLARDLPKKGRFKDYYIELTLVVRRYVERRHGIRAPRRTTEEFLSEARRNPAFTAETLARLGAFLAAADLVKFAGARTDEVGARTAAERARDYIASDAEAAAPPQGGRP